MKKIVTNISLLLLCLAPASSWGEMYPIKPSDKAYFGQVQKAVLEENVEWFSGAMSYPLVLKTSTGDVTLKDKTDVKRHAALIFSAHMKSVVGKQSSNSLFKNWQGVMIGDGEIWFSEVSEKTTNGNALVYRITAVNVRQEQTNKSERGTEPPQPPPKPN
jgi:hypothetical protein